jgi:hypothetical protein
VPDAPTAAGRACAREYGDGELALAKAELFLLAIDEEMKADSPRSGYLLGVAECHLAEVIELVKGRQRR